MYDAMCFYNGAEWHIKSYNVKWVYYSALAFIRSHEVETIFIKRPNGSSFGMMRYLGAGEVLVISFISGNKCNIGGVYNVSDHNE